MPLWRRSGGGLAAAWLCVVLTAGAAAGGDWPQFRHDAGRSAATPEHLAEQLHLAWIRRFPPCNVVERQASQAPFEVGCQAVAAGKTLYVGLDSLSAVIALNTDTGEERWRFYTGGAVRFAPAVAEGKVYACADDGALYCLSADEGKLLWRFAGVGDRRLVEHCGLSASRWPVSAGPVVHLGTVYFGCSYRAGDGVHAFAVSARTGRQVWHSYVPGVGCRGYASASGATVLLSLFDRHPIHFAADTGEYFRPQNDPSEGYTSQVAANATHYICGMFLHELRRGGRWAKTYVNAEHHVRTWAPVITDARIYGFNDGLFRVFAIDDPKQRRLETPGTWYANARGDYPWSNNTGEPMALPAGVKLPKDWYPRRVHVKAGPRLYAGGRDYVIAVEAPAADAAPRVSWAGEVEGMVSGVIAADGKCFVATDAGGLYCFGPAKAEPKVHAWPAARFRGGGEEASAQAAEVLKQTGRKEGRALVWGIKDGRLIEELLRQSRLSVIAFAADAAKVEAVRSVLAARGLLGRRLQLRVGDPSAFEPGGNLADLVVSEDPAGAGLTGGGAAWAALLNALAFDGGTAWLALGDAQHEAVAAAVGKAGLPRADVRRTGGMTLIVRREDRGRRLRLLTGAHSRVTWVQDHSEAQNDTFAVGDRLRLMAFDSDDGKGERVLLGKLGNYARPLFTPDGQRVIFTDRSRAKSYIVNWDGTGLKEVADGHVLDAWLDGRDGTQWVYVQTGATGKQRRKDLPIHRHPIGAADRRELVWDKTGVACDNIQVSADGLRMCGQFPWPTAGVAELPNKDLHYTMEGCWTSLAPDNSYVYSAFRGDHRVLAFRDTVDGRGWDVRMNTAPGVAGWEVYHPRWTNHARFMSLTGPYSVRSGTDNLRGRGTDVEVYLARFSEGCTSVAAWARITDNRHPDYYPDAWIEGGEKAGMLAARRAAGPAGAGARWPGDRSGLAFFWADRAGPNRLTESSGQIRSFRMELGGRAIYGRHGVLDLAGGWAVAEDFESVLPGACRRTRQCSVELAVLTDRGDQGGPAAIVTLSDGKDGGEGFVVGQDGERLVLLVRGADAPAPAPIGTIATGRARHVIVACKDRRLLCYLDGKPVGLDLPVKWDPARWRSPRFVLGAADGAGETWRGRVDCVAVYGRSIDAEEAAARCELVARRHAARKAVPAVEVDAKLVRAAEVPSPKAIQPYRRCLALGEYEVTKVLRGNLKERRILAAHWVILDGQVLPGAAREAGKTYRMRLEPFDSRHHGELDGERVVEVDCAEEMGRYYQAER